ncbi:hypothetical protein CONPUDRAFT_149182 [Coniophora puteana RWD-64-598 SS2]|uniref:Uncharacterized protein n=1 Tax=Coniophora puteana (strain RWD-64-598) TaxID=741705 RepID=A0A5M3N8H4_CONPW|nr:uncharacterized protein CONPUDRAFT_149182 [Coniophora puteana RWD-64-598 SS2]EIW87145.1 hypothetical protein CONPUDRAFT_149182 [Coniophora puteana RWD-64-598 SS2]
MDPMDEDVDMDAPQISTLREENTPPPSRQSKFRVKLLVSEKGSGSGASASPSSTPRKLPTDIPPVPSETPEGDVGDDDEDEEDQLIDDDDDDVQAASASASVLGKRKGQAKKMKSRKSDKPRESLTEIARGEDWPTESASAVGSGETQSTKLSGKKNVASAPRKSIPTQRSKHKAPKQPKTQSLSVPVTADDAMSETAYTGTAPSSPLPFDALPLDLEPDDQDEPPPIEANYDNSPMPVYPLPSKPFPVQPPPKIGTSFAPVIPLDRSRNKVRHWRQANREIRGIAGGRWFTKTWVGDKDSELSVAALKLAPTEKSVSAGFPLSKGAIAALSASSGKGTGKGKGSRAQSGPSANTSRAGSHVPDTHATKTPTNLRNIVATEEGASGQESDAPAILEPVAQPTEG